MSEVDLAVGGGIEAQVPTIVLSHEISNSPSEATLDSEKGEIRSHARSGWSKVDAFIGIETVNGPVRRADAVVPTSGRPISNKAVFIKSTSLAQKISIAEDKSVVQFDREVVQKSALVSVDELQSISRPRSDSLETIVEDVEEEERQALELEQKSVRSPQGRKFPSWFSYFYPGKSSSAPSSPTSNDSLKENNNVQHGTRELKKSILKKPKPVDLVNASPPPIVKSAFLRQEEVQRLTKFTERFRNHRSTPNNHNQPSKRTCRLKWSLESNQIGETFGRSEYERGGVEYIAKSLTPELAMMIKRELNEVKQQMPVHEESRQYTQFYSLR